MPKHTTKPKSTRREVGSAPDYALLSERAADPSGASGMKGASRKKEASAKQAGDAGTSEKLPEFIAPELATRVDKPPAGSEWIHEIKLDGYRLLARKDRRYVRLSSRNELDWTSRAQSIVDAVRMLPARSLILDGELIVLDENGKSNFQSLQNAHRNAEGAPIYVAFDILHLDGKNLRHLSLLRRKAILQGLLEGANNPLLRCSPHTAGNGTEVYSLACERGLEGILSKRGESRYVSGRGKDWLKVKCDNRQEFVICGYSLAKDTTDAVGALLLCLAQPDGTFRYSGKVGTGFRDKDRRELFRTLRKTKEPDGKRVSHPRVAGAVWVEPKLIAQVVFREMTGDGLVRQAVFQGLREDLRAENVGAEPVKSVRSAVKKKRIK